MENFSAQRARNITLLLRGVLNELPSICFEYIRHIEPTTQPLTRYAYACDLKLFFNFLVREIPKFSSLTPSEFTIKDIASITVRDIYMYLEYLNLYVKNDEDGENERVITNDELGKMRKLSSLRSFYKFLFKNQYIESDVSALVDMPKRHEKPIIRLEIDEVARLLDQAETGEGLSERQKAYHEHVKTRDLAIITLFLGTGIRVSELVGIDLDDVDFGINGFLVTRKGGNQVVLYFSDEVANVLRAYRDERLETEALPGHENALFLSMQRRRITTRAVENLVKKYAMLAAPLKKHLSPHKLRSTFGTNLYNETGDIYLVADVLGHSDVNTTRRHYAAMADDRRRMAAKKVHLRDDGETD